VAVYFDRYGHLIADTKDELHRFAERLGLKRAWFQDRGRLPHYDLTTDRAKRRALGVGAELVTDRKRFMRLWYAMAGCEPQGRMRQILCIAVALLATTFVHADIQFVVVPKPGESPLTSVTVTIEPNEPVHVLLVDMAVGVYEVYVNGVQHKTVAAKDGCVEFELEHGGEIAVVQGGIQRPPDVKVKVGVSCGKPVSDQKRLKILLARKQVLNPANRGKQ